MCIPGGTNWVFISQEREVDFAALEGGLFTVNRARVKDCVGTT
jgi:hypothetical protein